MVRKASKPVKQNAVVLSRANVLLSAWLLGAIQSGVPVDADSIVEVWEASVSAAWEWVRQK